MKLEPYKAKTLDEGMKHIKNMLFGIGGFPYAERALKVTRWVDDYIRWLRYEGYSIHSYSLGIIQETKKLYITIRQHATDLNSQIKYYDYDLKGVL